MVETAIVLQGGGALGAYEYGVLRVLYEQRPGFSPVAVAGVSIGAITAAVLGGAKGDPIAALDTLWRRKRAGGGDRAVERELIVTSSLPPELSSAGDFSRVSVEARIRAGYDDAISQGHRQPAGLEFGVTAVRAGQGAGPDLLT